jgi:hypothetical protein
MVGMRHGVLPGRAEWLEAAARHVCFFKAPAEAIGRLAMKG